MTVPLAKTQLTHSLVRFLIACVIALLPFSQALAAPPSQEVPADADAPLTAAFTYQGRLDVAGTPVNATCALQFDLWNAGSGGSQIGATQNFATVNVSAGLFNVTLNQANQFGGTPFTGEARFLEIAVQCPGDAAFVTLPRQQLTATPYALTSLSANSLRGQPVSAATPATGQVLTWSGSQWQGAAIPAQIPTDWSAITSKPAGFADGIDNEGWALTGNSDATSSSVLGTTNEVTFTIVVSGQTALRMDTNPNANALMVTPNIIGGNALNAAAPNVQGAVIGGGGRTFNDDPNLVFDDYGAVLSGMDNQAGTDNSETLLDSSAVVAGGFSNEAEQEFSTIGGGRQNNISSEHGFIGGGQNNFIIETSRFGIVPGGFSAVTRQYGQLAHAGGHFESFGDAQHSVYILRNVTNNATSRTLFLDCNEQTNLNLDIGTPCTSGEELSVPLGRAMTYRITVAAVVVSTSNPGTFPANTGYGWTATQLAYNSGAGVARIPFPSAEEEAGLAAMTSVLNVIVSGTGSGTTLRITVQGSSVATLRWIAVIDAVEVATSSVVAADVSAEASEGIEGLDE